jgi:hypothetical protein
MEAHACRDAFPASATVARPCETIMVAPPFTETFIAAKQVRSLVWSGDSLIDWVAGGAVYRLDGSYDRGRVSYAHKFDAAVTSPGTDFAVIYVKAGTKGLLLKNGQIIRELNRSFYHAAAYEYPVCLLVQEGRTLLVHCPDQYNKLEIEDAATGERLTCRSTRVVGFFHSRLSANPSGTRLLSAGWVWTPVDVVAYFDITRALRDPDHLNGHGSYPPHAFSFGLPQIASAAWQTDTNVILTACQEPEDSDWSAEADMETPNRLRPCGIAVHDTASNTMLSSCVLDSPAGTVMPVGDTHVVGFYKHPRLVRLTNGAVEHAWPAISSGTQLSSIIWSQSVPPLALDPANARFAIAQEEGIHVISLRPKNVTASPAER